MVLFFETSPLFPCEDLHEGGHQRAIGIALGLKGAGSVVRPRKRVSHRSDDEFVLLTVTAEFRNELRRIVHRRGRFISEVQFAAVVMRHVPGNFNFRSETAHYWGNSKVGGEINYQFRNST